MELYKLDSMIKGWFVGNFQPTAFNTNDVEVAVKRYKAGEAEKSHHHKIATELTVIITGTVKMNDREFSEGDIIKIEPGYSVNFTALTDVLTVVVKLPGATNDKYID